MCEVFPVASTQGRVPASVATGPMMTANGVVAADAVVPADAVVAASPVAADAVVVASAVAADALVAASAVAADAVVAAGPVAADALVAASAVAGDAELQQQCMQLLPPVWQDTVMSSSAATCRALLSFAFGCLSSPSAPTICHLKINHTQWRMDPSKW